MARLSVRLYGDPILPAFMFFVTPLSALWSRRHEFEADAFASQQASAGDLATALVKLYRDNATTLTPDGLYSTFYYSHPAATERIARLRRNEAGQREVAKMNALYYWASLCSCSPYLNPSQLQSVLQLT